ncbi:hypothetical protein Mterra_01262 [Calidithermus terrae]|uniref:Uncharacterized protein n=1 Tax=Calidithermus terrae TaxID=1408545 RepID=A0A399EU71_9DEIN|nr:hypothetical protein [Calidithermus terrae]RIH87080.1 hypothetical protein Mterra_01262 [Calidithermus terrae]
MTKLEIPLHPKLEKILGYPGLAPRVVFYFEPGSDTLMYDDGHSSGSGNSWAYLIWAAHPSVKPHLLRLEGSLLLLDRRERRLYAATREQALTALKEAGATQIELEGVPAHDPGHTWKEAQQMLADFVSWLGSNVARKAA